MENNSPQDHANNQFVLSYELLSLLQWMVEHDTGKLKKIIARSLHTGLRHQIQNPEQDGNHSLESAQYTIVEFFGYLETLLLETMHEQAVESVIEKNLMPALDQLDSSTCDDATVRLSIEKATLKFEQNPHQNPQEILFKELLKRWKPRDKNSAH